jgi:diguanylate cyclase (GGDEF)-like protein
VFQLTIWSLPPLAAAAITFAAFLRARPQRRVAGGYALRFLFLTLFFWSAFNAIATLVSSEKAIFLATQFAYLGVSLAPVAWFVFALTYSQRVLKISRHALNTISALPLITMLLALSNSSHHLVWIDLRFVSADGFTGLITEHGFWFYVHAVYSYALILVATAVLAFALTQYKQHHQSLLAAVFAPVIAVTTNLLSLSPWNPYPWLDLTMVGFVVAVLILDVGIMRRGLLRNAPVSRERVIEQLKDPVLVLNHDGEIIDANQSALSAWDHEFSLLANTIDQLIPRIPSEILFSPDSNSETTIAGRAYEIASTPLDPTNVDTQVAIVFRDVTERRAAISALQNAKAELQRMAHTDALTNMHNRRYFMERLQTEFERIQRHGSVLSVLLFDLDHFKKVNDTYGHDIGDAVLIAIADVVNQVKRGTDIACRFGGEEFALLLPETDKIGAINLAQRMRRSIESYPYATKIGHNVQVTASIGVATLTQADQAPENLLKTADRALYKAKDGGRNMVCINND